MSRQDISPLDCHWVFQIPASARHRRKTSDGKGCESRGGLLDGGNSMSTRWVRTRRRRRRRRTKTLFSRLLWTVKRIVFLETTPTPSISSWEKRWRTTPWRNTICGGRRDKYCIHVPMSQCLCYGVHTSEDSGLCTAEHHSYWLGLYPAQSKTRLLQLAEREVIPRYHMYFEDVVLPATDLTDIHFPRQSLPPSAHPSLRRPQQACGLRN